MSSVSVSVGQKFNRLTIISKEGKDKYGRILWKCQCDCGNEKILHSTIIKKGYVKSCGCLQKENSFSSRFKDITGKRYGRLIAIEYTNRIEENRCIWKFKCDCGNDYESSISHILNGSTVSCGCYGKEKRLKAIFKDLTGNKFDRLLVIGIVDKRNKYKKIRWLCRCDCGSEFIALGESLKAGHTKSCGCLNLERITKRGIDHHNYKAELRLQYLYTDRRKNLLSVEYNEWKNSIYKKYNYICQKCNNTHSYKIHAHHILNWKDNEDKRYDKDNGVVLCQNCHIRFHKMYGKKNNSRGQLENFIKEGD